MVCPYEMFGYRCFYLTRASSVVHCQATCFALHFIFFAMLLSLYGVCLYIWNLTTQTLASQHTELYLRYVQPTSMFLCPHDF